jgi:hypothetical protein
MLGVVRIPVEALIGLGVGIFALLNVQALASSFVGRAESVAGATVAAFVGARLVGSLPGVVSGLVATRAATVTGNNGSAPGGPGSTPPTAGVSSPLGVPLPDSPTSAAPVVSVPPTGQT